MNKKKEVAEKVTVKMKVDQNLTECGNREKDEVFQMSADLAKLHEGRGILKIVKEVKNVNE